MSALHMENINEVSWWLGVSPEQGSVSLEQFSLLLQFPLLTWEGNHRFVFTPVSPTMRYIEIFIELLGVVIRHMRNLTRNLVDLIKISKIE